jgi:small conductance mechanosensitive channel
MKELLIKLWNQYSYLLPGIGRSLIIAVLIILGGRMLSTAAGKVLKKAAQSSKVKIDDTMASVLHLVINYGIIIIAAIMILENFGFNTTSLIALLGASGVAIGLSLKNTLSNIASGIILFVLRPFQQGDFIEVGPSMGTVRKLDLFLTVIETNDGVHISVPNSNLWGPPVKNYSRNKKRRVFLSLLIPGTDPLDTAIGILEAVAKEETRFLHSPLPQVFIKSVGESGTTIVLSAWVNSGDLGNVNQDIVKIIKEKIEVSGLHVPFPRGEITLRNEFGK